MSLDERWTGRRPAGPGVLGVPPGPTGEPAAMSDRPDVVVDLSCAAFDDHLAQLGRWAKEGWDWEDIADRVCDLFDVPTHLR